MSAARLQVGAEVALADEPLAIKLSGLAPGQRVTLRARATIAVLQGSLWSSEASFEARGDVLDLARDAPSSGSYDIAHPMGLVWSMRMVQPGEPVSGAFIQRATPWSIQIDGDVDGRALEPVTVTRIYATPGVVREELRAQGLVASVFRPATPGRHPVVITLSGSNGGLSELTPALHASRGYVGVGLAYFGIEPLPGGLAEIPLEYFARARGWLANQPFVDAERIAVSGASRGGELALLLASTFPWVRAAIAYVPSGLRWAGFAPGVALDRPRPPSWTLDGKALAFAMARQDRVDHGAAEVALTPGFLAALADEEATRRAEIEVERANGSLLLLSGGSDAMWPSRELADIAVRRLERAGFSHPFEHVSYPEAGHAIGVPYLPTTALAVRHPVIPEVFSMGGSARANALAGEDAWRRVRAFLRDAFA